jgi:hypothetical protein
MKLLSKQPAAGVVVCIGNANGPGHCVLPIGTFSTFSLEALSLLENGEMAKAGLYVGGSVVLSIEATIFGAYLSRNLRIFG